MIVQNVVKKIKSYQLFTVKSLTKESLTPKTGILYLYLTKCLYVTLFGFVKEIVINIKRTTTLNKTNA